MTPKEALENLMAKYYEMCQDTGNNDDEYQRNNKTSERAILENSLKVLEILKNKKVQLYNLMYYIEHKANPRKYYNYIFDKDNMFLTEEEYNLLKEWIEDLLCGM